MPADIDLLPEDWERSETSTGIPYYLNHGDETTQWEHPRTSEMFIQLDGMNDIRFGAYRTAMKLRAIQKMTLLNRMKCHMLERSYKELAIGPGPKHNNETCTVHELEALLSTAFQFINQETTDFIDVEQCVELTQNFVLQCLDSGRTGKMKVRSIKNILTAMGHSTLEEKYGLLFQHVCSENSAGISQSNLKALLLDLLLLANSVSESCTFAPETINDATVSCWESSNHFEPTHILNSKEFLEWMFKEPICVVWLPTVYRLTTAEAVKHEAKCAVCYAFPIVGFRYRCLKCINVNLCQHCYWTQKTLKNHKITHPTREYCLTTTTGDDVRDFAKQLKNKMTRRYRRKQPKVNYLKYRVTPRNPEADIPDECPVLKNIHTRVNVLAERLQQLEGSESSFTDPIHTPTARPLDRRPPAHDSDHSQRTGVHLTQFSLEGVEELENYVMELQAANDTEVLARMELEKSLHDAQGSVEVGLEMRDGLEQQVHDLQEINLFLKDKVSHLLATPAVTKTIRGPSSVSLLSPPCYTKTQGVNTASTSGGFEDRGNFTLGSRESTPLVGGDDEEMKCILRELLAAFPQQKKEVGTADMNRAIFQAGASVTESLTALACCMEDY